MGRCSVLWTSCLARRPCVDKLLIILTFIHNAGIILNITMSIYLFNYFWHYRMRSQEMITSHKHSQEVITSHWDSQQVIASHKVLGAVIITKDAHMFGGKYEVQSLVQWMHKCFEAITQCCHQLKWCTHVLKQFLKKNVRGDAVYSGRHVWPGVLVWTSCWLF